MFLQKAYRGTNELHWYILTFFIVVVCMVVFQTLSFVGASLTSSFSLMEIMEMMQDYSLKESGIDLNMLLAWILSSFLVCLWVLRGCIKRFHKKTITDVTTGRSSWDWSRILFGFGAWAVIMATLQVVDYYMDPENYIFQLNWAQFLPLVVVAVVMLPFQTTFEEIFMRGYLMQGIAVATQNRWAPLIITSLLFGGMHMLNPEVMEYGWGIMMVNYAGVGLLLGMVTLMDDGLELAIGIHAANNILSAVMVTFDDSALQTYAIFSLKELEIYSATIGSLVLNVIFFFICKWKYQWTDWSKLYANIQPPDEDIDLSSDLIV